VGREYYEPLGIEPEVPVEAALGLILQRKLPRSRAPGAVLASSQFPAPYFSVSALEQWFGREFADILDDMSGVRLREDGTEPDYWRFNRVTGGWARVGGGVGVGAGRGVPRALHGAQPCRGCARWGGARGWPRLARLQAAWRCRGPLLTRMHLTAAPPTKHCAPPQTTSRCGWRSPATCP
jgi:hypothetical protein